MVSSTGGWSGLTDYIRAASISNANLVESFKKRYPSIKNVQLISSKFGGEFIGPLNTDKEHMNFEGIEVLIGKERK